MEDRMLFEFMVDYLEIDFALVSSMTGKAMNHL